MKKIIILEIKSMNQNVYVKIKENILIFLDCTIEYNPRPECDVICGDGSLDWNELCDD